MFSINYMSLCYLILFVPINFPSVAVLDSLGLKSGIGFGIVLTTIGLWIRCLVGYGFIYAIIGQTIMALAQPFIFNGPTVLSANWFPQNERILSTSVGAYANVLGIAFGCFVPSIFFNDNDGQNPELAKTHCLQMGLLLAGMATVVCIPALIFLKNKPHVHKKVPSRKNSEENVLLAEQLTK